MNVETITTTNAIDPRSIKIPVPREMAPTVGGDGVAPERTEVRQPQRVTVKARDSPVHPDKAEPLAPESFPNKPRRGSNFILATIPNLQHLLVSYGIDVHYDVIRKKLKVSVPGYSGMPENADNVALAQINSLATLNGMQTFQIPSYVEAIGDRNPLNPIAEWITGKAWDGTDRLPAFYATLVTREDYPRHLKEALMYRWLISCVAAALLPTGFRCRGVLTLQGPQSIGKTAWVSALVPDAILREGTVKLDHHLDSTNKDSLVTAISHWVVEIGELDSSFRKDVARLKGFITSDRDKVRRPYARTDSEYPRRTVFCATVNDHDFLVDATGNTRWWAIPVTEINYTHGIDMQQLFAQLARDYESGERWWLSQDEEQSLEHYNKDHRTVSAIRERVMEAIDLARANEPNLPAMTPTELLSEIGIDHPTNSQSRECGALLRECLGESKRIRGVNKWRVPKRIVSLLPNKDDDKY